jgi:hypothetical protein
MWVKQFLCVKKMVVVPHSTFHRLAAEAGDPTVDRELSFINMTTRCGSTLLCQMVNTVPKARAMSEPCAFNHAHAHYVTGRITIDQLRRLVKIIVMLLCKRERMTQRLKGS